MQLSQNFDISRNMEKKEALSAFSALGQDIRLDVFRALAKAGADGLSAGNISKTIDVLPNTLSTHLAQLTRAELISVERQGRSLRYFANMAGIQNLLTFLMKDCCGGNIELCFPDQETQSIPTETLHDL